MFALVGAGLLLVAACAARAEGPPAIELDRTACSHCGMLISEPVYAAAYRAPGDAGRVFDDIGCLIAAARKESAGLRFWFHDAARGEWIDGQAAVFVVSPKLRTPMGGGVIAFDDAAAAARAAARHGGEVVSSIAALFAGHGGKS
jgi:copper chaperone NosL